MGVLPRLLGHSVDLAKLRRSTSLCPLPQTKKTDTLDLLGTNRLDLNSAAWWTVRVHGLCGSHNHYNCECPTS